MRNLLIVAAMLGLGACQQQPAEQNVVSAATPAVANASGNPLERVLAFSDKQRNVVFIRALLDAKLPCDTVTKSTRIADQNGAPAWDVQCSNGASHLISITPDGIAHTISRTTN